MSEEEITTKLEASTVLVYDDGEVKGCALAVS